MEMGPLKEGKFSVRAPSRRSPKVMIRKVLKSWPKQEWMTCPLPTQTGRRILLPPRTLGSLRTTWDRDTSRWSFLSLLHSWNSPFNSPSPTINPSDPFNLTSMLQLCTFKPLLTPSSICKSNRFSFLSPPHCASFPATRRKKKKYG